MIKIIESIIYKKNLNNHFKIYPHGRAGQNLVRFKENVQTCDRPEHFLGKESINWVSIESEKSIKDNKKQSI